jgi:hypothetical protein
MTGMKSTFISGNIKTAGILIPRVSTEPGPYGFWGAVMVRWGFNRNKYKIDPGLYATGSPGPGSDVFVTANYKLTFDLLRKNLSNIDGWILVLDTKGINVWCAAGKGTFSTKELVNRIKQFSLDKIVSHKRLILPQLGATGVAAHKVKDETGFNVHYGPVRASDIEKFIKSGYRADKEMRKVKFSFADRIKLIPNDFLHGKFFLLGAAVFLYLLSGLSSKGLSYKDFSGEEGPAILKVLLGSFSLKGIISGIFVFLLSLLLLHSNDNLAEILSWLFIMVAISSFLAMNFTGSSTYTSLSGVRKEMRIFIPFQAGFALTGIILQVIGKFI